MINYQETIALVQRMKRRGLVGYNRGLPIDKSKIVKEPKKKPQRPICRACKSNRKPQHGNCANCGQRFVRA
jgi:hypothetical protein